MNRSLYVVVVAFIASLCGACTGGSTSGPTSPSLGGTGMLDVRLSSDAGVSGLNVVVSGNAGTFQRTSNSPEMVRFESVPLGQYTVSVTGRGVSPARTAVDLSENRQAEVSLMILPPYSIDDGTHVLLDGAGNNSFVYVKNGRAGFCSNEELLRGERCASISFEACMEQARDVAFDPDLNPNGWGRSYWLPVLTDSGGSRPLAQPLGPINSGMCQTVVLDAVHFPSDPVLVLRVTYGGPLSSFSLNVPNACPSMEAFRRPLPTYPCIMEHKYLIAAR